MHGPREFMGDCLHTAFPSCFSYWEGGLGREDGVGQRTWARGTGRTAGVQGRIEAL